MEKRDRDQRVSILTSLCDLLEGFKGGSSIKIVFRGSKKGSRVLTGNTNYFAPVPQGPYSQVLLTSRFSTVSTPWRWVCTTVETGPRQQV